MGIRMNAMKGFNLFVGLLWCFVALARGIELLELTDANFKDYVTNSDKQLAVIWRPGGLNEPDEALRAFEDASRQFATDWDLIWGYVNTDIYGVLAQRWEVSKFPTAQYYAKKQSYPRGVNLPIGYTNPNIMAGIVIDPGFIASKLRKEIRDAEMKVLEARCRDEDSNCKVWAEAGECRNNPGFMTDKCKRSCLDDGMESACPGVTSSVPKLPSCYDEGGQDCFFWARDGQCESNPDFMMKSCRFSCKQCIMSQEDRKLDQMRQLHASEVSNKKEEQRGYLQRLADDNANEQQSKAAMSRPVY